MHRPGRHHIADFFGCAELDAEGMRRAVVEAVSAMNATLVDLRIHAFSPRGSTGVAILAESHLAFHTWPEHDYVAVDVFTCGDRVKPAAGIEVLRRHLLPERVRVRELERGLPAESRAGSP